MYHVYVLYSVSNDKTYVGYTSDLTARLISHNIFSASDMDSGSRCNLFLLLYAMEVVGGNDSFTAGVEKARSFADE
jgi:predicted GIY-YIG superfamily endonuclease